MWLGSSSSNVGLYRFSNYSPRWVKNSAAPSSEAPPSPQPKITPLYSAPVGAPFFVSGRRVGTPLPSPDGTSLIYMDSGALTLRSVSDPGGEESSASPPPLGPPSQLTDEKVHPITCGNTYGGSTFCWEHDGAGVIFVSDGSLYRLCIHDGLAPTLMYATAEPGTFVYAPTQARVGSHVLTAMCVESSTRVSVLLRVSSDGDGGGGVHQLVPLPSEDVFAYDPIICAASRGGDECYIACNAWTPPNMRWTGSKIVLHRVGALNTNAAVISTTVVAGDDKEVCAHQHRFSPCGEYVSYYTNEADGWLQLWAYHIPTSTRVQWTSHPSDACKVQWVTGSSNYCWVSPTAIVSTRLVEASLEMIYVQLKADPDDGVLRTSAVKKLDTSSFGYVEEIHSVGKDGLFTFVEHLFNCPPRVILARVAECARDDEDGGAPRLEFHRTTVARSGLNLPEDSPMKKSFTAPLHVTYGTSEPLGVSTELGSVWDAHLEKTEGVHAHGLLYYRLSADRVQTDVASIRSVFCGAPAAQPRPPMMVWMHGGPTSLNHNTWSPIMQYFVSRGVAVFAVNYRGSQGYGREYQREMHHRWGVVDTIDALMAAKYMWELFGWSDECAARKKTIVMGGSAGGFATLNSLIRGPNTFGCGVCLCGVTDLHALDSTTHLLERHYNATLIGSLPDAEKMYKDVSPIHSAEYLKSSLLMIHGGKDDVVPLDQAVSFIERAPTGIIKLIEYPEEGHMLSKPSTIREMLPAIEEFINDAMME